MVGIIVGFHPIFENEEMSYLVRCRRQFRLEFHRAMPISWSSIFDFGV